MTEKFTTAFNKAQTKIDIARATADTLCQAYNSDDGVDRDNAQMVLIGIIENLEYIREEINTMFDEAKGGAK